MLNLFIAVILGPFGCCCVCCCWIFSKPLNDPVARFYLLSRCGLMSLQRTLPTARTWSGTLWSPTLTWTSTGRGGSRSTTSASPPRCARPTTPTTTSRRPSSPSLASGSSSFSLARYRVFAAVVVWLVGLWWVTWQLLERRSLTQFPMPRSPILFVRIHRSACKAAKSGCSR